MNRERSLAHIEIVTEIQPIPEKDRIVLAKVLGWSVVIGKEEFAVGEKVVYVEIDSRINTNFEAFKALAKDADRFGFVGIKTRKFGNAYSQGICFKVPDAYVGMKAGTDLTVAFNKGKDGTELAIIHAEEYAERRADWDGQKKEAPKRSFWGRILHRLFPRMRRSRTRGVPSPYKLGVHKTDEERIQNLVEVFERLKAQKETLVATEKLDGQSFTAHIDSSGKVYVASRNVPLYFRSPLRTKKAETYGGSSWEKAFERHSVQTVLERIRKNTKASVTIQGEILSANVQGNPYRLPPGDVQLKVFNIIVNGKRVPFDAMESICKANGLETVPYIGAVTLDESVTMEEFIARSDGASALNGNAIREGIVYRTTDYALSFKAISNKFLVKRGE